MTPIQQAIAILEEDALTNRIERALEVLRGVPQSPPELTATCQKSLPGGEIDDTTYSQIEDALDEIDAPMTAPDGRFFTLVERIKSLSVSRPDRNPGEES